MIRIELIAAILLVLILLQIATGQSTQPFLRAAEEPILPPLAPWNGKSRALVAANDDPWVTPQEVSGFRVTTSYDETVAWLRKLVDTSPQTLKMISLGKSPQGRDIWMVIASSSGAFTPADLKRSGKPTLFWQCGIHSGEIDGKDAGMMMLREMTVRGNRKELLDRANLLFIPIFSVDGHERVSKFNRSNQRGPENPGWRTTSRNLNLNRDFAKLDSPEMRAIVRALDEWDPDLYFDIHVTDGADYQYDITWGTNGEHSYSPNSSKWINSVLTPQLEKDLKAQGHIPGPLVFADDSIEFRKGIIEMTAEPRFSHGYGDARHLPSVLVENHALKPHDQRVLGTYVMLESVMRTLGSHGKDLRRAIDADHARKPAEVALDFAKADGEGEMIDFAGIEYRTVPSDITGGVRVEWLGKHIAMRLPYFRTNKIVAKATRPRAYWIPPAWSEVIERLSIHGIKMETIDNWREIDVTMYRLNDPKLDTPPFEGHMRIKATPVAETRREKFPPGSVRISTDQPLGDLAISLLEPAGPDSFFQWGFFHEVMQRTEYIDPYIMEPMAEKMMQEDAKLREEFIGKLATDKDFAASPAARLEWFYAKTPFYDERWRLYPVAREE